MNETTLKAIKRTGNLNILRKSGFIPGVLYGEGFENGAPVKFEESKFNKLIHSKNTKVWVEYDGNRLFGMAKELQKDTISGKVIHADIRILSRTDNIRIKLPIIFTGISELEHNNLSLKIQNGKVDVSGKAGVLPGHVTLKVEDFKAGDTIKLKDLQIDNSIAVHDPENEIYATVIDSKSPDDGIS